jgi:hypothetical protein
MYEGRWYTSTGNQTINATKNGIAAVVTKKQGNELRGEIPMILGIPPLLYLYGFS